MTGSRLVPQGPASTKSEADVLRTKKNFFLYDNHNHKHLKNVIFLWIVEVPIYTKFENLALKFGVGLPLI